MTDNIAIVDKILYYEFLNFLEIYIHTVLYLRDVYPRDAFFAYQIYNTKFRFIVDDTVCSYISDFLKSIENLVFQKMLKKVYICIIDNNNIIEIFNMDISFAERICDFEHEELKLYFKSLLSNFWQKYVNKESASKNIINTKFQLCIETKESKVFSNFKLYKEILNNMEENYIKNIFNNNDLLNVYKNYELCIQDSEFNIDITIYRNFK